jgi:hypothetical protein
VIKPEQFAEFQRNISRVADALELLAQIFADDRAEYEGDGWIEPRPPAGGSEVVFRSEGFTDGPTVSSTD